MTITEWLEFAYTGLYRKSAFDLDACGFPMWFIRAYRKAPIGWGKMLNSMYTAIDFYEPDTEVSQ